VTEQGASAEPNWEDDLLAEADILREHGRCARAYFLAHVACEELGKLPILITAAVADHMGRGVNWRRIDHALRSHEVKIKQALFMDSLHGGGGMAQGKADYEADVRRMKAYLDFKNASLYSFQGIDRFGTPQEAIPCENFDALRKLAQSRRHAFDGMYVRPVIGAGGLQAFLARMETSRVEAMLDALTGDEGREALKQAQETGDDSKFRALFDRLLSDDDPTAD
jgi:AbiV family abortive infection protein